MPNDETISEQEKSTEEQQESQPHAEVEQLEDKDGTNAPMPKISKGERPKYMPPYSFIPFPERLAKTKLDK
jgi:hypothetical protein